jgi:hypothetical protein
MATVSLQLMEKEIRTMSGESDSGFYVWMNAAREKRRRKKDKWAEHLDSLSAPLCLPSSKVQRQVSLSVSRPQAFIDQQERGKEKGRREERTLEQGEKDGPCMHALIWRRPSLLVSSLSPSSSSSSALVTVSLTAQRWKTLRGVVKNWGEETRTGWGKDEKSDML